MLIGAFGSPRTGDELSANTDMLTCCGACSCTISVSVGLMSLVLNAVSDIGLLIEPPITKKTPSMMAAEIPAPIPNDGACITKHALIQMNLVVLCNSNTSNLI